jgi:alkaline phosphatase D
MNIAHLARLLLILALPFSCIDPADAAPPAEMGTPLRTIAFGSCAHQDKPQPIWQAILAESPELFVFLGDNIYGDTRDMQELNAKYARLAAKPGFDQLQSSVPTIAIWDDHDYGENDAGADYPHKTASRRIMLDFWREPADSPRRDQQEGIYTSYLMGPQRQTVQIILLDLRWNRSPLNSVGTLRYQLVKSPKNLGPSERSTDPNAQLLGEAQWRWLEKQLAIPADIRIIGSSIQLLAEFTGWESWANFPADRARLLDMLAASQSAATFIISGDTHWAEISRLDDIVGYPLWEITSSGLTEEWKAVSPNRHRVGEPFAEANYGLIKIDWDNRLLDLSVRDVNGQVVMRAPIALRSWSP